MNPPAAAAPLLRRVDGYAAMLPESWRAQPRLAAMVGTYLALSGLALSVYLADSGPVGSAAYLTVSTLAPLALLVGVWLHRPASAAPWAVLALGQVAFLAGDLAWFANDLAGAAPFPSVADVFYLAGYPLTAVGLALFIVVRWPAHKVARLVDAGAIGIGCAVLLGGGYIARLGDPGLSAVGRLTLLAYPLGDSLLLAAAAYVLFAGNVWRGRAQQALLVGLASLLGADLLYGLFLAETDYARSAVDGLWLISYVAIGLSALLPSMREMTQRRAEDEDRALGVAMLALLLVAALLAVSDVVNEFVAEKPAIGEVVEMGLVALLFLRTYQALRDRARHEQRTAVLLANASEALAVVDTDGRIRLSNPAAGRLIGNGADFAVGRSIFDFVGLLHPDDRRANAQQMRALLSTPGARQTGEVRVSTGTGTGTAIGTGTYRLIRISSDNRVADPAIGGVVMTFHDVTEQRASEERLARLAAAVEQADEAVVISDPGGRIEYVNPAFERMTGYTAAEAVGENPRMLKSGHQPASFYKSMWATLTAGRPWIADFVNLRKDGTTYQSAAVISSIRDEEGSITGYVGVSRDVTAERREEAHAAQLARERALIAETIRAIDTREPVETIALEICGRIVSLPDLSTSALVVFESDGQAIPYGIVAANGAQLPRRRLPKSRVDEVRAQANKGPWIEAWAERSGHPYNEMLGGLGVKAVAYAPIRVAGEVIGYLLVSSAHQDAEEALSAIMPALVEFADVSAALVGPRIAERTQAEAVRRRVMRIISDGAFQPVFQPIVDIFTGRVVGYEALTRFDSGVDPEEQFDEAAAVGLGKQLELAAAREALGAAAELPAGAWLNINASPALIMDGNGFTELVANSARPMVVELTEHEQIRDYAEFRAAVRRLGPTVRLAVDDAGAGFASLRHILELQPSFVKLDRALTMNVSTDQARQALVAGMRHFAADAGFWIIAEGVETEEDLTALRGLDIHYAQGYLLGSPQPTTATMPASNGEPHADPSLSDRGHG